MAKRLIEELMELNRAYSGQFVAQSAERERYHAKHPTNIATFKCMDGRVNLSRLTHTPIGIIRPFRNIGGVFDLGWSVLNTEIVDYVRTSSDIKGRNVLFLVTYHFARGSIERGCRGHHYDVAAGTKCAAHQVEQIRRVFHGHKGVYAILVGVETDRQSLIFHGQGGRRVSMEDLPNSDSAIVNAIRTLYPDIPDEIMADLTPLMRGNIVHVRELSRTDHKLEDREHKEHILALGHGFEWIPYNHALVINDLELTLDDTVGTAAGIIKENHRAGRTSGSKATLLTSVTYEQDGYMKAMAVERSRYLTRLGLDSIRKFHPDLRDFFEPHTCVMRWQDRLLEVIDD